jgi:hypothetical protein
VVVNFVKYVVYTTAYMNVLLQKFRFIYIKYSTYTLIGYLIKVSMPTGSLCAERNVIGSALSADITLKRRELKMIAVLSVSLDDGSSSRQSSAAIGDSTKGSASKQITPGGLPTSPDLHGSPEYASPGGTPSKKHIRIYSNSNFISSPKSSDIHAEANSGFSMLPVSISELAKNNLSPQKITCPLDGEH